MFWGVFSAGGKALIVNTERGADFFLLVFRCHLYTGRWCCQCPQALAYLQLWLDGCYVWRSICGEFNPRGKIQGWDITFSSFMALILHPKKSGQVLWFWSTWSAVLECLPSASGFHPLSQRTDRGRGEVRTDFSANQHFCKDLDSQRHVLWDQWLIYPVLYAAIKTVCTYEMAPMFGAQQWC